jgi:hypothetical protein
LAVARHKPPFSRVLVLLLAAYSGLYASRSLPVSSLLLTLIVAPLLTQAIGEGRANSQVSPGMQAFLSRWEARGSRMTGMDAHFRGHLWAGAAIVLGLVICAEQGKLGPRQWMNAHFDAKHFPVQAVEEISRRGLHEPGFAPDSWGGYLIYRLYPQTKIFVDDRHDLYGQEFLKDYLKAMRLTPDWDKFLNEKRVNWVLVPAESSLANMLEVTSGWNVVYRDGTAVLFERKPSHGAAG